MPPTPAPPPRLLDRVRAALRTRHCSLRTEKAYVGIERNFAASTQNQALSALLFLYKEVLEQQLPWMDDIVRAKTPVRIPVVLTREEVRTVIAGLDGPTRLLALLLYGAGLRLLEAAQLRVKDVDFERNQITVRAGKGAKDRVTMLPAADARDLAKHLEAVRDPHAADLPAGPGWGELPWALGRKYPNARREWIWQWGFPATRSYCTARPVSAAATTRTNPCCSAR